MVSEPGSQPRRFSSRGVRRALISAACVSLLLCFIGMTRLVFFPERLTPTRADVVFVLGPAEADRLELGERLVEHGYADALVISAPDNESRFGKNQISACVSERPYFVFCGRSIPYTTQGEMALLQRLSDEYSWDSVLVVTSRTHASRAALYAARCFDGSSSVIWTDPPLSYERGLQQLAYQTGGFVKAFTLTNGCVDEWSLW